MSTTFPMANPTEHTRDQEDEAELEKSEEGNSQARGRDGEGNDVAEGAEEGGKDGKEDAEKAGEVVVLEEDGSEFEEETLDMRARRRSFRTARKEEMVEVEGKLVESATKAVEEFQMAERKRKGKQIATPSKKRKPRQASMSVVIQESITDLTKEPYYQEEGDEDEGQGRERMETSESEESERVYEG